MLFFGPKTLFFRVRVLCQNNLFFGSVFLPKILGREGGSSSRVCRHLVTLHDFVFSVVLSLATAGIALRLFNIKLPQLHAHHIVDKTASRTSSAPAVEQLLSNDLFVGAPCLGCSNLLTQAASGKKQLSNVVAVQ